MPKRQVYIQAQSKVEGEIRSLLRKAQAWEKIPRLQVQDKIPKKATAAIEKAFQAAFENLFMGGLPLIEATFAKEGADLDHLRVNFHLDKDPSQVGFHNLRQVSKKRTKSARRWAKVESVTLGLLGIGLPDIPVYLASILRNLYLLARAYGFTYDREEDKVYLVRLIRLALDKSGDNLTHHQDLLQLGRAMDLGQTPEFDLEKEIRLCAQDLNRALLVSRVMMTLPLVGVLGGAYQPVVFDRIEDMARLHFEYRYLDGKIREEEG